MSSRRTWEVIASRDKGGGGYMPRQGQQSSNQNLGIPSLRGLSGGPTMDATGNVTFNPYEGKTGFLGGLFGSPSKTRAAEANFMYQHPAFLTQLLTQQQSKLSAQEAIQEQARMTLEKQLQDGIMKSAQFNAIATQLGIPVDQLAGQLSQELAANAVQKQRNIGAALKQPDVAKSEEANIIGNNQAADARNRNLTSLQTGVGGVATMPGPLGGKPTSIFGATPYQNTQIVGTGPIDPVTKMPMMQTPVTTQAYQPGRVNTPIPQDLWNQIGTAAMPTQPSPATGNVLNTGMPAPTSTGNFINNQAGIANGTLPTGLSTGVPQSSNMINGLIQNIGQSQGIIPSALKGAAQINQDTTQALMPYLMQAYQALWSGQQ